MLIPFSEQTLQKGLTIDTPTLDTHLIAITKTTQIPGFTIGLVLLKRLIN